MGKSRWLEHEFPTWTVPVSDVRVIVLDRTEEPGSAVLILPRDLTTREAERVCAFIRALALVEEGDDDKADD